MKRSSILKMTPRVFSPVLTPFRREKLFLKTMEGQITKEIEKNHTFVPCHERFLDHCKFLLENQVGLAVFGTNSEANSLSLVEKKNLLHSLVSSSLYSNNSDHDTPLNRETYSVRDTLIPGTGLNSIDETLDLTNYACDLNCKGVLMLPPFFYRDPVIKDDNLFHYFDVLIQALKHPNLRIILYHNPHVGGQVGFSVPLIRKLRDKYPENIVGIKDSSGDWTYTKQIISEFANDRYSVDYPFEIFCGSETFLLSTLEEGGYGCISATTNVNPGAIARFCSMVLKTLNHSKACNTPEDGKGSENQNSFLIEEQKKLNAVRLIFQSPKMIASMKSCVGFFREDEQWRQTRPPLLDLNESENEKLIVKMKEANFQMKL